MLLRELLETLSSTQKINIIDSDYNTLNYADTIEKIDQSLLDYEVMIINIDKHPWDTYLEVTINPQGHFNIQELKDYFKHSHEEFIKFIKLNEYDDFGVFPMSEFDMYDRDESEISNDFNIHDKYYVCGDNIMLYSTNDEYSAYEKQYMDDLKIVFNDLKQRKDYSDICLNDYLNDNTKEILKRAFLFLY